MSFITEFNYFFYLLLFIYCLPWPLSYFTNFKDSKFAMPVVLASHISISILAAFFIIFSINAGLIFSLSSLIILTFVGCFLYDIINIYKALKEDDLLSQFKYYLITIVISLLFFQFFFSGDNVYKLHKHCKPTSNPEIYKCLYENGTYVGGIKSFKRHGQGNYLFHDGKNNYNGGWQDNEYHGKGLLVQNGKRYEIVHKNGKEISKKLVQN